LGTGLAQAAQQRWQSTPRLGFETKGPPANAVLTTVVDAWGQPWTPRCPSASSGLLRRSVVDSSGPEHSPEKRTVAGPPGHSNRGACHRSATSRFDCRAAATSTSTLAAWVRTEGRRLHDQPDVNPCAQSSSLGPRSPPSARPGGRRWCCASRVWRGEGSASVRSVPRTGQWPCLQLCWGRLRSHRPGGRGSCLCS